MLTLTISPEVEDLLATMSRETGRSAEEIARRALLDALEDYEDTKLAEERLRTTDGTTVTWDEVRARYFDKADLPK